MPVARQKYHRRAIILLVEDDPGDQELTRRALSEDALPADLFIVNDGEEALDFLFRRGEYRSSEVAPRPDMILLDLNMPRLGGHEVLKVLKKENDLGCIPVVVLSTSNQERDVAESYQCGCNSFIEKPIEIEAFTQAIRDLGHYWFDLVTLLEVSRA